MGHRQRRLLDAASGMLGSVEAMALSTTYGYELAPNAVEMFQAQVAAFQERYNVWEVIDKYIRVGRIERALFGLADARGGETNEVLRNLYTSQIGLLWKEMEKVAEPHRLESMRAAMLLCDQ